MMNHTADLYRIKPLKMLSWWILNTFFIFPLTATVLGMLVLPVAYIASSTLPNMEHLPLVITLITIPAIGGIIGACISFLQRPILRERLYWAADHWTRWTVIGGAVGAIVTFAYVAFIENSTLVSLRENEVILSMMSVFLLVLSAFQVVTLRHAVKQSWLWIAGNVVAGVVFFGVLVSNPVNEYNASYGLQMFGLLVLAVLSLGVITGMVILFLFENHLHPMQPETEADIPTETDKPASVWDEVV